MNAKLLNAKRVNGVVTITSVRHTEQGNICDVTRQYSNSVKHGFQVGVRTVPLNRRTRDRSLNSKFTRYTRKSAPFFSVCRRIAKVTSLHNIRVNASCFYVEGTRVYTSAKPTIEPPGPIKSLDAAIAAGHKLSTKVTARWSRVVRSDLPSTPYASTMPSFTTVQ